MMTAAETAPVQQRSWLRVGIATALVVLVVVAAGLWWVHANRKGVQFSAMFTAAVGVYPGSEVRILGVPVGAVDSVTPRGTHVRVGMHLDPGYSATKSTYAVIISPNLVSDRYVQLTGVWTKGPKLAGGSTIPSTRTRTPVELDQLNRSLIELTTALGPDGANKNGALNRALRVGAANLKGNGKNFNSTIDDLSKATTTLAGSRDNIFGTIGNLARFTGMLKTNNSALVTVNENLASVSQTFSDDRASFGAAMRELGNSLSLVQQFIHDNRAALSSNVARLGSVARTLARERTSLTQALQAAPQLVDNFVNAYDSKNNVLRGRANLNELTIWAKQASAAGSTLAATPLTKQSAATTAQPAATPGLLPASNVATTNSGGSGR